MSDPGYLQLDRFGHVMTDQLKSGVANPMSNVLLPACEVIIQTDHFFSGFHQPVAEMGSEKTSTTGDQIASEGCWHQEVLIRRMMS